MGKSSNRWYEILPGALAWGTLVGMVIFSWKLPAAVSIFIILFDIYWLLKTIYLSLHLRATFKEMRENLNIDWELKIRELGPQAHEIWHLVIFPMYKEPYALVRESFESIFNTKRSKDRVMVVLAIEERGGEEARKTAENIKEVFGTRFAKFLVTIHPANIPGEIPGKGSNEAWAAKVAQETFLEEMVSRGEMRYEDLIVSVFDIDTHVPPHYFGRLTYAFLTTEDPLHAIYQPVPLFVNNIYEAPPFARIVAFSCTFWQMMQQSRPERLTTFSSQAVPFTVLRDVGFWQKDIVSEDSRIFWQAFLCYHGKFRVVPLSYPVSMDANVAPTFWATMSNLYKQQRRWGWGVENVPYMLRGFRSDHTIPQKIKWYWSFIVLEGFHSWATNSFIIFALGWLPVILGGAHFSYSLLSYSLPQVTRFIIQLSMIGVATSAIASILLLPPRPQGFRAWHYMLYIAEWLLIPITLIVFGAIPGLEAQTRLMLGGKWKLGFWVTPKGRHTETEKGVGESRKDFPV